MSLTWIVKEAPGNSGRNQFFAGTLTPEGQIEVTLQVWNNHAGHTDAADMLTPVLVMHYGTTEDSTLLERTRVDIDNTLNIEPALYAEDGVARIRISQKISGKANDGDATKSANRECYKEIKIKVAADSSSSFKNNDLKNLYLNILEDNQK